MRRPDVRIGMRVTSDDPQFPAGVVADIDPEEPGREFLIQWDDGGRRWCCSSELEPEVTA